MGVIPTLWQDPQYEVVEMKGRHLTSILQAFHSLRSN